MARSSKGRKVIPRSRKAPRRFGPDAVRRCLRCSAEPDLQLHWQHGPDQQAHRKSAAAASGHDTHRNQNIKTDRRQATRDAFRLCVEDFGYARASSLLATGLDSTQPDQVGDAIVSARSDQPGDRYVATYAKAAGLFPPPAFSWIAACLSHHGAVFAGSKSITGCFGRSAVSALLLLIAASGAVGRRANSSAGRRIFQPDQPGCVSR